MAQPEEPWSLELDSGFAWSFYNDAQIPGDTGTRFDLENLTGNGTFRTFRSVLTYEGETGPGYRVLWSPFQVSGTGTLDQPTNFDGTVFAAGQPTKGTYRFDSYRLTYRNRWKQGPNSDWRIGATLKVRDAEVSLEQGALSETSANTGLVPLLHVYGEERLSDLWTLSFDIDGLAAPQGRAFDVAVRAEYAVTPNNVLYLSARTLEGGADNDEVYTFAGFGYLTLGTRLRF
jgi:hypothetical protein